MRRILLTVIVTLFFLVPCFAVELTPEQEAEDKVISHVVKEINTQIARNTLVTSETIETIGNQIAGIIEKAGYSKEEYFIQTLFCPVGHIHYRIKIKPKTQNGSYAIDSKYFFKHVRIKPKKGLKTTI